MDIEVLKRKLSTPGMTVDQLSNAERKLLENWVLHERRSDFKTFNKAIVPEVTWMGFQEYIMDRVQATINKPYGRLIIEMPPQHGKTTIASYHLAAYYLGRYADRKVAVGTFNAGRAAENTAGVKNILGLRTYKEIFPTRIKSTDDNLSDRDKRKLAGKKDSSQRFQVLNNDRGEFKAVGVGEGLTGFPADLLIIDDYHKDHEEAESSIERDKVYNWYTSVVMSRSQDHGTPIIIFATRWHADDLIGRIRKLQAQIEDDPLIPKWEIISFPALRDIADFEERPYDTRALDEPLWKAKVPLYRETRLMQPKVWISLWQGRPPSEGGVVIQRSWLREYNRASLPELFDKIVISIDTSFNARAKQSDDCAIMVWAAKGLDIYLLEFQSRRMGLVETQEVVESLIEKYPRYHAVIVELKANGSALIELLKLKFSRIVEYDPKNQNKRQRLEYVAPLFQAGRIFVPDARLCPQIHVFVDQLVQFSGQSSNEKDDLVDATTQALLELDQFRYTIPRDSYESVARKNTFLKHMYMARQRNSGRH